MTIKFVTRSYIYDIKTHPSQFLCLPVPDNFRHRGRNAQATDLPAIDPELHWMNAGWTNAGGLDYGNQVEDVILWIHQFTPYCVDRVNRQESLGPVRLEYLPTARSRKWRKGHQRPVYIPILHDREAQKLATQEGWHEWRYVAAD